MNSDNRVRRIQPSLLPHMQEAIDLYTSNGGSLSDPKIFGEDPLASNSSKKQIRLAAFTAKYSFDDIFHEVSNGNGTTFKSALKYFIDITYRLSVTLV